MLNKKFKIIILCSSFNSLSFLQIGSMVKLFSLRFILNVSANKVLQIRYCLYCLTWGLVNRMLRPKHLEGNILVILINKKIISVF